jgi:hypothetical protein
MEVVMENTHDRQRSYYQHREEDRNTDIRNQLEDELDSRDESYRSETPRTSRKQPQIHHNLTFISMFYEITNAFMEGWRSGNSVHKPEKRLRENLSEKQIDEMVEDSFPSSDPPSTY